MNSMSQTEAAYVAGLLDGEGCFSVFQKKDGAVGLSLSLYMTNREVMDAVKKYTGTTCNILPIKGRENRKDQWLWKPSLSEAKVLVEQILPYLIVKRRNAELFIELLELRKHSSRWDNKRAEQLAILEENTRLNKRGIN